VNRMFLFLTLFAFSESAGWVQFFGSSSWSSWRFCLSLVICIYVCMYRYVCMYVCTYVYVCICIYVCILCILCMYIMYVYMYVCTLCIYVCMYIMYVYVCICIYVCMSLFSSNMLFLFRPQLEYYFFDSFSLYPPKWHSCFHCL
jgi:nuclear pore complex protein Nup62